MVRWCAIIATSVITLFATGASIWGTIYGHTISTVGSDLSEIRVQVTETNARVDELRISHKEVVALQRALEGRLIAVETKIDKP